MDVTEEFLLLLFRKAVIRCGRRHFVEDVFLGRIIFFAVVTRKPSDYAMILI